MVILNKWNVLTKEYEPLRIPNNWKCKTYSNDMEELVNCPQCGKKIRFGDCYTSLEVHTNFGMGYAVCEDCYNKEWERRNKE